MAEESHGNSPSLWDIQRILERNYTDSKEDILDLKAQLTRQQEIVEMRFTQYLLKAVYDAEKKSWEERIDKLEREASATRARATQAVYTALASATAAILAGIVLAIILGRG